MSESQDEALRELAEAIQRLEEVLQAQIEMSDIKFINKEEPE